MQADKAHLCIFYFHYKDTDVFAETSFHSQDLQQQQPASVSLGHSPMSTPACLPPRPPAANPNKYVLWLFASTSNGCCIAGADVKQAHPYLHLESRRHDSELYGCISRMRTATEKREESESLHRQ